MLNDRHYCKAVLVEGVEDVHKALDFVSPLCMKARYNGTNMPVPTAFAEKFWHLFPIVLGKIFHGPVYDDQEFFLIKLHEGVLLSFLLSNRAKCAFHARIALALSLFWNLILALWSSVMSTSWSSSFWAISSNVISRHSHISHQVSWQCWHSPLKLRSEGSLRACTLQWSLLFSSLPTWALKSVFK